MRALLYDGQLRLVSDFPRPSPVPGEALLRVKLAGICNTDLEITRGYMGFCGVLGHEFVGVVEECTEAGLRGQRVVGEINCCCGVCPICLEGHPTHCPQRTTLGIGGRDGAMAEYCLLPVRNLHPVPDNVSDEQAVFVEPLAAALEILEQVHVLPTQQVVVLGDGKLGLLVAQVLRLTGCDLLVVGRHEDKLAILHRLGIATRLAAQVTDTRADVVVDCSGHPDGFVLARALVKPRGTLVLKSTFFGQNEVNMTSIVVDEVSIIGSRCGPFAPALRLLDRHLVDVESLIAATYSLDEALTAFAQARSKGSLKVLLRP
ncbi:MAG: zinc-binding dehydrogenase [Chloroflexi bacterium]|nr:zinc-binding dehydrogenase [Chloroflexota bacterium]